MKIGIVVGHTSRSPGAYSPTLAVSEYYWNSDLADMMVEAAKSTGLDVRIFYRDGGGVPKAYHDAEMWGAQETVELHFNSFADPAATGTETLHAEGSSKGKPLAASVQKSMVLALELPDRGLVAIGPGGRGWASLTAIAAPAILVEPFFGSNPQDCAVADERKQALAAAIIQGLWQHERTGV